MAVEGAPAADAPEVEAKELQNKLHVTGVKLHIKENTEAHHTDDYECTKDRIAFYEAKRDVPDSEKMKLKAGLVIRRGQEFKMTIDFDRPYSIKENDIMLMFNLGDDNDPHKRLNVSIQIDETGKNTSYKPKKWGATVVGQEGNSLTVSVFVPATAAIGEWAFSVRTTVGVYDDYKSIIWEYKHITDFITILFNPWCKEDLVYMEDEKWRRECVESDSGVVYTGGWTKVGPKAWLFGQFCNGILDACLRLVMRGFGRKPTRKMASPSAVSRIISQMEKSFHSWVPTGTGTYPSVSGRFPAACYRLPETYQKPIVGNWSCWSGDYSGGARPTSWTGSVKILRQYLVTGEPVCYGQCWVFSGVTATVCRALGIPCRSVTNHSSAHNTDNRLTIDVIARKGFDGQWHEEKVDSIWNFHVWNECWFRTPNLNTDKWCYDGWQIIDATPQEYSDGVFCCGPAPLVAVREGHLNVGWDTGFVYAEVNGDKVWWKESELTGRLFETKRNRKCIGRTISTHQPTGMPYESKFAFRGRYRQSDLERDDLVFVYKYPEGSDKEKEVNRLAEKTFRQMNCIGDDEDSDLECEETEPVDIEIKEMKEEVQVGSGFGFNISVKNRGSEDKIMKLVLVVLYKTYFDSCTGIAAEKIINDVKLKKGTSQTFTIEVDEKAGYKRPQDGFNFEVKARAEFKASDHIVLEEMEYRLRRPDIEVQGPSKCGLFDTIKMDVSFTNPLKVSLTGCQVEVDGLFDFVQGTKESFPIQDIGPGETWKTTLTVRPKLKKMPERMLCVGLESNELGDISGSCCVRVSN